MTSCFARVKRIEEGWEPVSIARGQPAWFRGRRYVDLAPSRPMLKLARADFCVAYHEQLSRLDPERVFEELGPRAVLLCWEPPNVFCHRRLVAEWLERQLGVVVTEWGFRRDEIMSADEMPEKPTKPSKGQRAENQGLLGFM